MIRKLLAAIVLGSLALVGGLAGVRVLAAWTQPPGSAHVQLVEHSLDALHTALAVTSGVSWLPFLAFVVTLLIPVLIALGILWHVHQSRRDGFHAGNDPRKLRVWRPRRELPLDRRTNRNRLDGKLPRHQLPGGRQSSRKNVRRRRRRRVKRSRR